MSITPEQRQAWREDAETAQAFLNNYAIESDTHAATRILALLEALDAAERERDTWITRKRTADETADIVSAKVSELVYECEHLKDRAERAEAELDRHGPCICNTGPGTDGPDEFCPRHGRTYNDALDLAARHVAAAKAEALREAAEAVPNGDIAFAVYDLTGTVPRVEYVPVVRWLRDRADRIEGDQ